MDLTPTPLRRRGMTRRKLLAAAAAVPLALALPRTATARRSGGTSMALVTADEESHVVALDLDAGTVAARIRLSSGPRSIESAFLTWAVVAHTAFGRLSVLHAPTLRLRRVLGGFRAPRYTAIHPTRFPSDTDADGRPIAYVTDSGRGEVVTVDVVRGRILWRTTVGGPARHIAVTPDAGSAWTALGTRAERVAVLDLEDPRRPRVARSVTPPFLAHDVVASDDGRHVWITSGDRRRIAVYESDGRRPVAVLAAHAPPQHVAFRGGRAFVASGDDGTVRVHDADGRLVDEAQVPVGSYNVTTSPDGFGRLGAVTPSLGLGTVALLDERGAVTRVRRVARAAHDACLVVSA